MRKTQFTSLESIEFLVRILQNCDQCTLVVVVACSFYRKSKLVRMFGWNKQVSGKYSDKGQFLSKAKLSRFECSLRIAC